MPDRTQELNSLKTILYGLNTLYTDSAVRSIVGGALVSIEAIETNEGRDIFPPAALSKIKDGEIIQAIKIIREIQGLGLRDAKLKVDEMVARLERERDPEYFQGQWIRWRDYNFDHCYSIPQRREKCIELYSSGNFDRTRLARLWHILDVLEGIDRDLHGEANRRNEEDEGAYA